MTVLGKDTWHSQRRLGRWEAQEWTEGLGEGCVECSSLSGAMILCNAVERGGIDIQSDNDDVSVRKIYRAVDV